TLYQVTSTPNVDEQLNDVSVLANGDIRVAWAANDGTLGDENIYATTFTPVSTFPFKQVSAGYTHTCGVRTNGTVEGWGDNSADKAPAQRKATEGSYTSVSAACVNSCALTDAGVVECWGSNSAGQAPARRNALAGTFTEVSAGWFHTCGLRSDGVVECWGLNLF